MGKDHERGSKTFTDKDGSPVMYASPSNLTPAGETKQKDKGELKEDEKQMKELVADRVAMIRKANPEQTDKKVPVDLVTCSGSGWTLEFPWQRPSIRFRVS